MSRLWILISYRSQVFEPSPHGLKGGRSQLNVQTPIPCSSRLSGGVLEDLGWEPDWALDSEVSVLGSVDEVGADYAACQFLSSAVLLPLLTLLQRLDVSRGEGDPDLVDLGGTSTGFVEVVLVIHCDCFLVVLVV